MSHGRKNYPKKETKKLKSQYTNNSNERIKLTLTKEQNKAYHTISSNTITFLIGRAGTGKTQVACYYAYDNFLKKNFDKIYLVRPTVTDELSHIGFLKGTLEDKMKPWVQPIIACFEELDSHQNIECHAHAKRIEVVPIEYIKGRTVKNSVVIIDEAQDINVPQLKKISSRCGEGSKMIFCGDLKQTELSEEYESGMKFAIDTIIKKEKVERAGYFEMTENHRDPIVDEILCVFEKHGY